ncbi:hypothetical protein PROFUN_10425, partial [Planoprotostelium fungivorum]
SIPKILLNPPVHFEQLLKDHFTVVATQILERASLLFSETATGEAPSKGFLQSLEKLLPELKTLFEKKQENAGVFGDKEQRDRQMSGKEDASSKNGWVEVEQSRRMVIACFHRTWSAVDKHTVEAIQIASREAEFAQFFFLDADEHLLETRKLGVSCTPCELINSKANRYPVVGHIPAPLWLELIQFARQKVWKCYSSLIAQTVGVLSITSARLEYTLYRAAVLLQFPISLQTPQFSQYEATDSNFVRFRTLCFADYVSPYRRMMYTNQEVLYDEISKSFSIGILLEDCRLDVTPKGHEQQTTLFHN